MKRVAAVLLTLVVLAVAGRLCLPLAGRVLIRSDSIARADLIVVLGSGRLERSLEAGTLFHEGWSQRILLMHPPDRPLRDALAQLNVRVPIFFDLQRSVLAQMRVPSSAIIESPLQSTTREEAIYATRFAREQNFRRIIVVTSPYHTRRAGSFFRAAAGDSLQIIVRANRYEPFDASRWWRRPSDRTDVVFEYLKIVHAVASP